MVIDTDAGIIFAVTGTSAGDFLLYLFTPMREVIIVSSDTNVGGVLLPILTSVITLFRLACFAVYWQKCSGIEVWYNPLLNGLPVLDVMLLNVQKYVTNVWPSGSAASVIFKLTTTNVWDVYNSQPVFFYSSVLVLNFLIPSKKNVDIGCTVQANILMILKKLVCF